MPGVVATQCRIEIVLIWEIMATYAIGDVQGCHDELLALIKRIRLGPSDRLWFVGDLVNRGPKSLEVLRMVRDLGDRATVVLGNHDLHLISLAEGLGRPRSDDTLAAVLDAPDRDELLGWLRSRRLVETDGTHVMVHAGLLGRWSVRQAIDLAGEVWRALNAPNYREFLRSMYGNTPDRWDDALAGADRARMIVNGMTRMRFCRRDGSIDLGPKGAPADAPAGYQPWFTLPERAHADHTVVFGHWSALGLHVSENVIGLDTGCVWGGKLTAMRLEDRALFDVPGEAAGRSRRWQ
jgi:bis(5'-nucleosyl)-tetraphosphatase (symmetrical)